MIHVKHQNGITEVDNLGALTMEFHSLVIEFSELGLEFYQEGITDWNVEDPIFDHQKAIMALPWTLAERDEWEVIPSADIPVELYFPIGNFGYATRAEAEQAAVVRNRWKKVEVQIRLVDSNYFYDVDQARAYQAQVNQS